MSPFNSREFSRPPMCGSTNLILHFYIDPLEDQNFKRIALRPTSFHVTCHERFANAKSFASCFRIVRRFALRRTTAPLQFDPCTEASRPEPRDRGLLLRERHGESLHGLVDARVADQQLGLHGRYPSIALNFASYRHLRTRGWRREPPHNVRFATKLVTTMGERLGDNSELRRNRTNGHI